MMNPVNVKEAASRLGLSARRIRRMLHDGQIRGGRLGNSWVIERDELGRLEAQRSAGGRPWSCSSAWAVLAESAEMIFPNLSPHERSRARRRLAERGIEALSHQLRSRASDEWFYGHPSVLERIKVERGIVLAGVSAAAEHDGDILALGFLEAYVSEGRLQDLVEEYQLDDKWDQANIHFRAVMDDCWPFLPHMRVAPKPVVGVDLLGSLDERSRRAGALLLAS